VTCVADTLCPAVRDVTVNVYEESGVLDILRYRAVNLEVT
jgi:hypothetical protein